MTALVGVDIGTTSTKALAVDVSGNVLAEHSLATPWTHNGPCSDLDPQGISDAVKDLLAGLVADDRMTGRQVLGVGFSGIAETGVLLDKAGVPLGPALAWYDPRSEHPAIREIIGREEFQRHTGMRLNSKPSISKILWLQRNLGISNAVRHLCIGDWMVRSLGGDEVAELSLVSRTGLYDILARTPWEPALEIVGSLVPQRVVVAGEHCGVIDGSAPSQLQGAALTVAGQDHQTAGFIMGAARAGSLFDSMGTAEALLRQVDPASLDLDSIGVLTGNDVSVGWGVVPGQICLLAALLTGLTLERVSALLGIKDRDARREVSLAAVALAADSPNLRISSDNDDVRIEGVAADASPEMLWRTTVHSFITQCEAVTELVDSIAGPHTNTTLTGGWSRDPMMAAAKTQQFGAYATSELAEAGAMGAAFFAGIAAGVLERPGPDDVPRWL